MSQTGFSPESPADLLLRLLSTAFLTEVREHPDDWPMATRKIAIDCVKCLVHGTESANARRDINQVQFTQLSLKQNDTLYACYFEVIVEMDYEIHRPPKPKSHRGA
jgi:hypothetical protein